MLSYTRNTQKAQHWTDILLVNDCEPSEQLDQLVKDAAHLFKTPIAMINVLTPDQVVFKACVGNTQAAYLDRNGSFCDVAVARDAPLMIVDATKDEQFKTCDLVTGEMHIRSYLGKSLHAPDGTKIATLCLLDTKPRVYTKLQQNALKQLAEMAEVHLAQIFSRPLLTQL